MRISPSGAAFKFVEHLRAGFSTDLSSKLIPQVFHQLKTLKLT
jgi:hypothetical protein